jgi:7,8-dihydropterin-6-yl-methyl-4-(beta-D-ribofuranosyl)aminobenzene 5'-phosphate synthase
LDKTILFDTGTKPDTLLHNMKKLGVKIRDIDVVVLSHEHGDHIGGLFAIVKKNPAMTVYAPASFSEEFYDNLDNGKTPVIKVSKPVEISPGVHLTGEMGESIIEQGLVIDTPKGSVVILGCSHPGVDNMVERAKEIVQKDVYLVFGGFHMLRYPEIRVEETIERLKEMGVKKCGATHCTGDNVIDEFRKGFAHDFVTMGTGRIIEISR